MAQNKIILVVEDNDNMRLLIRLSLQPLGFEVVEARNGEEGLEKLVELKHSQSKLALIITDYNMPVMDGLTFIRTVRTTNTITPILVLSAQSEDSIRKQGKEAGANGWAIKPFVMDTLQKTVKTLLGNI